MFTVISRADASTQIGTGHVMCCLALADTLAREEVSCRFIGEHFLETIRERGHKTEALATGANEAGADPEQAHAHWLGVSWQEDARWKKSLRRYCGGLMLIAKDASRREIVMCKQPLDFNKASIQMNARPGFHRERGLRKHRPIGDRRHDLLCDGLLRRE